jgi:cystathionine beta-lyase/cystathionine gamma-synthase
MAEYFRGLNTKLIHAGEPRPLIEGAVSLPIFQSSTFQTAGADSSALHGESVAAGEKSHSGGSGQGRGGTKYLRLSNSPNHTALHEKLAAVEEAEAALVTASGMAAISTALLAVLKPGDRLMLQSGLYGGTHSFVTEDLVELGIGIDFFDAEKPETWKDLLAAETRAIYVESISNPLMKVGDLPEVVGFAREHGLVSMIDNTFTSPVNYRPPREGFDLSLHSCTKYLGGHSDVLAGAIIGGRELVERCNRKLVHLGGTLDPHACSLLHRGMKTLALRVERHNSNARQVAGYLERHPKISSVNFPGLPGSPYHTRASALFDGPGGMLSFEVEGGTEAADRCIRALSLPISAPSLGGVESLITRPATTSHASMSPEARASAGISDSLIRLSVGIEDVEDLIEDLEHGLAQV